MLVYPFLRVSAERVALRIADIKRFGVFRTAARVGGYGFFGAVGYADSTDYTDAADAPQR